VPRPGSGGRTVNSLCPTCIDNDEEEGIAGAGAGGKEKEEEGEAGAGAGDALLVALQPVTSLTGAQVRAAWQYFVHDMGDPLADQRFSCIKGAFEDFLLLAERVANSGRDPGAAHRC
jgi:hypothetical protein